MSNKWIRWAAYGAGGIVAVIAIVYAIGMTRSPEVLANVTIDVAKPVPYVYDLLADPRKTKDWYSGVESVEVISQSPLRYRMKAGGMECEMEVVEADPPKRIVTKTLTHPLGMSGVWDTRFEPTPAGTRIVHQARMNFESPFLRFMAMVMDVNKEEAATLVALKAYAESH